MRETGVFGDGAVGDAQLAAAVAAAGSVGGAMSLNANGAAIVLTVGIFVKIINHPLSPVNFTTAGLLSGFTMPDPNRLQYTGVPTRRFAVSITGQFDPPANNNMFQLAIAKNGLVTHVLNEPIVSGSVISVKGISTTDPVSFALTALVELATLDYIEPWATNLTGILDPTFPFLNTVVK